MVIRQAWNGLVTPGRRTTAEITLRGPLSPGKRGGSGAFRGLGDDNERYWVKTLNNTQDTPRLIVNEQIVGRAGKIIDAPVPEVRTIEVSHELAGWEFRPGRPLAPGIAHGSREVTGCVETNTLTHRADDENSLRHAYILALYDWCWGADEQWLVAEADQRRYFSHDHGSYIHGSGANWQAVELEQKVDQAHELADPGNGIDDRAVDTVASRLDAVNRASLIEALTAIPKDWPITDDELEAVGFFLERRASEAARRLRQRFGRLL